MQSLLPASGVLYEITSMVRVEVKFIGSDRIGRYIATGKIGIGISVKWRIGATLIIITLITYIYYKEMAECRQACTLSVQASQPTVHA